jgi:hypothetical protein
VPDHQDHAVPSAALLRQGYSPSSELVRAEMFLLVPYMGDPQVERERVRAILQGVHATSLSGPDLIFTPVRFDDESQDDRDAVDERPVSARGPSSGSRGKARRVGRSPAGHGGRAVPAVLGVVALGAAAYAATDEDRRRPGLVVAAAAAMLAALLAALGRPS